MCIYDVKQKHIWEILFYEAQQTWDVLIVHSDVFTNIIIELYVFIPLYSLYMKYNFPFVYSCNIIVGNKWFGLDQM